MFWYTPVHIHNTCIYTMFWYTTVNMYNMYVYTMFCYTNVHIYMICIHILCSGILLCIYPACTHVTVKMMFWYVSNRTCPTHTCITIKLKCCMNYINRPFKIFWTLCVRGHEFESNVVVLAREAKRALTGYFPCNDHSFSTESCCVSLKFSLKLRKYGVGTHLLAYIRQQVCT